MNIEHIPCPYCAGTAELYQSKDGANLAFSRCTSCGNQIQYSKELETAILKHIVELRGTMQIDEWLAVLKYRSNCDNLIALIRQGLNLQCIITLPN